MKHKPLSITIILLSLFLITQFIGLYVVNAYNPEVQKIVNPATGEIEEIDVGYKLPFGLESTNQEEEIGFLNLIIAFALAFAIIFLLMKYKWKLVIKLWFLFVIILAMVISINAFLKYSTLTQTALIALIISVPLAVLKIFRPNVITHNLTELLVYPGIAAVFVPILVRPHATTFFGKTWPAIAILIIISIYDMWMVWKVKLMQKMAKFQMEEIKVFGGFLIPITSKKIRDEIKRIKQKYKGKKIPKKIKRKKFKVKITALGGGDVIFPIIIAGVFLRVFGLIPALFITAGALLGLIYLTTIQKSEKAYPAMPYITVGIFIAMIIAKILSIV